MSWAFTIWFQGVVFGLIQGLLSGKTIEHDHGLDASFVLTGEPNPDSFATGGLPSFTSIPPLLRLPVELILLCSSSGLANVLADKSLITSAEDEISSPPGFFPNIEVDPRTAAKTLEDFELLDDDQVWPFICLSFSLVHFRLRSNELGLLSVITSSMLGICQSRPLQ